MNAETRAKATPEQQAKIIVESLRGRQDGWQWAEHIIAQAIRQAENDKLEEAAIVARRQALEEAARVCDGHMQEWSQEARCSPRVFGQAAREIRALKGFEYPDIRSPKKD